MRSVDGRGQFASSFLRDGGSFLRDGGSFLRDGGSFLRDGGSFLRDGGSFLRDGGSFLRDGGSFLRDGGACRRRESSFSTHFAIGGLFSCTPAPFASLGSAPSVGFSQAFGLLQGDTSGSRLVRFPAKHVRQGGDVCYVGLTRIASLIPS
jgi:hypothetical protein